MYAIADGEQDRTACYPVRFPPECARSSGQGLYTLQDTWSVVGDYRRIRTTVSVTCPQVLRVVVDVTMRSLSLTQMELVFSELLTDRDVIPHKVPGLGSNDCMVPQASVL